MQNRPLRPFEQGAHLHVLDWAHDTARYRLQAAGAVQVKAAAKVFTAADSGAVNIYGPPELPALQAAVLTQLRTLYALGHATVRSELAHQASGQALPVGLSEEFPASETMQLAVSDANPDMANLADRARLIAQAAAHAIWQAVHRARLQGITDRKTLRTAGRDAGAQALRQAASHHAGGTINAGRHRAALTVVPGAGNPDAPRAHVIGARYTSVLDKNTCPACQGADDGVLRALDDPALAPAPNPACAGGDRCRCIRVYQLSTESQPEAIAAGG
jgi:hypothetical protein